MIKIRLNNHIKYFLIIILCFILSPAVFAVERAGVQYVIPIDYSMINETKLKNEADAMYTDYLESQDAKQKQVLLYRMLSACSVLGNVDKENPLYFTRLGIIFDKLGKDRYAKSNFCRAVNLIPNYPYAYYSFANYYFDRGKLRIALREYMRAYNTGYQNHYYTLYQVGTIYEKFGDFEKANSFFRRALSLKYSEELNQKIQNLDELLKNNSLYNEQRGMRK